MERATPVEVSRTIDRPEFQSTPARDGAGDEGAASGRQSRECFNPRPLAMERATSMSAATNTTARFQSTPARDGAGDRRRCRRLCRRRCFNPRPLAMERATLRAGPNGDPVLFQSTPARDGAGDQSETPYRQPRLAFQSTPARDGAGDWDSACNSFRACRFNPRPLAMERATWPKPSL